MSDLEATFRREKVLSMAAIKHIVGTRSRMTAFRRLKALPYRGLASGGEREDGRAWPQGVGLQSDHDRPCACRGGGPSPAKKNDIVPFLEELLEPDTAGDPTGERPKWCRRSTRSLSQELTERHVTICPNSVGKMLKAAGFSLRCCRKSIAETQHPDRDRQFHLIADQRKRFEGRHQPILSVDTKKRELVGNFSNKGKRDGREAAPTFTHDFRSYAEGVAIPFGLYDLLANPGLVVVGTSYDTPEFAVDAVHTWLTPCGFDRYPGLRERLVLADSGGSNGARPRVWKHALYHRIGRVYGIRITGCHYPPRRIEVESH